jgi:hypothetical protein
VKLSVALHLTNLCVSLLRSISDLTDILQIARLLKAIFRPIEARCNELRLALTVPAAKSPEWPPQSAELIAWPSSGHTSTFVTCRI